MNLNITNTLTQELQNSYYSFEEIAKYYDRTRKKRKIIIRKLATYISSFINYDGEFTIMEPGIGTGEILYPFIKKKCKIVGVDVSDKMLNIAADKYRSHGIDVAVYNSGCMVPIKEKVNLYRTEFLNGFNTKLKFDCILTNLFIHLNKEWRAIIDKIARLLNVDGIYAHLTERNDYFQQLAGLPIIFWPENHPIIQVLKEYDDIRQSLGFPTLAESLLGPYLPEIAIDYSMKNGLQKEFTLESINEETMHNSYLSISDILYDIKHRTISSHTIVDPETNKQIMKELTRFLSLKQLDIQKRYEMKIWYNLTILRK